MITFLPYPDFAKTAHVLDSYRLNKQMADVAAIIDLLHGEVTDSTEYRHSVVQSWNGFEVQLIQYGITLCEEWASRGFDSLRIMEKFLWQMGCASSTTYTMDLPPWFGKKEFHLFHRSLLISMDYNHYSLFFDADTPPVLPFLWPVE